MSTKKKTWTGQEKLAIVLQGLRGNCRISELCNDGTSSAREPQAKGNDRRADHGT